MDEIGKCFGGERRAIPGDGSCPSVGHFFRVMTNVAFGSKLFTIWRTDSEYLMEKNKLRIFVHLHILFQ